MFLYKFQSSVIDIFLKRDFDPKPNIYITPEFVWVLFVDQNTQRREMGRLGIGIVPKQKIKKTLD